MGFRGVTTNPPLCLQAVQLDPRAGPSGQGNRRVDRALDVEGVYWKMYLELVQARGRCDPPGFREIGRQIRDASGQVDPRFVTDGEACWRRA